MLSYKYKLMQVLGPSISGAGLLAATVLRHPLGGAIGLAFGTLFLPIGTAATRLKQRS